MDANYKSPILMDYVRLETDVRQKAQEYLDDVSDDNLKSFVESARFVALSVLEKYFFSIDELYTNGACKIADENVYNKFIDFHDGYRALMKNWSSNHEIAIRETKVDPSLKQPELSCENLNKHTPKIVGIGTLVAAGLYILSDAWKAVAAEVLALGTATLVYKQNKKNQESDYAFKVEQYERQLKKEKDRLATCLINDLKQWLKNAEQYSNSILVEFGV